MNEKSSIIPERPRLLGWQVGITYQSEAPGGVDREHLMRLLDEMAENEMNLLSLMMISYANYDPNHDGYCWPVQNPRLRNFWDSTAINGSESTEFVREVICTAAQRGIEVQLFMNWGLWNPARVIESYPSATRQKDRQCDYHPYSWRHCPDCPDVWQKGLDEVTDLLSYYDHPNVTSYVFECIDYGACFCEYTQKKFLQDTGSNIFEADDACLFDWKSKNIYGRIKAYIEHIKGLRPDMQVWLHSRGNPESGQNPNNLRKLDLDYLLPHTIQFPTKQHELYNMLDRLAPKPCVLHFCVRDKAPRNYPIWIKTPEIIAEVMNWVAEYPGDNLVGILFFNETIVSDQNRNAVYQQLKRWQQGS